MRITTARQQFDMLTPWHTAAGTVPPVPVGKPPGRGQENPGYGQQTHMPIPQGRTGDWAAQDWRNAEDGGAFHSSVRPPMSSDIPHPDELGRKRPTDDPVNDPWGVLNGSGQSFEGLVQNHMSHQMNMTPDQAYAGRVWYQAAHDATKDLADKTTGDHGKAVATMSAFSPKTGWDENLEKGHHFLTHYDGSDPNFTVPGMGSHTEAAKAIYHSQGDGWKQALTGPKRSAFANNILDTTPLREPRPGADDDAGYYNNPVNPATNEPDWRMHPDQDSTIDTHHVRMSNTPHGSDLSGLKYETPKYFGKTVSHKASGQEFDPSYDLHSRAAWEATRRINAQEPDPAKHLVPKQVQAGPWTKFKADVDAAGKGANLPEPGEAPKSYDQAISKGKTPDEWAQKHPLTNPIPRYQKDQGEGWWDDPRRPKQDLRTTPNWNRHSHLLMLAMGGGGWWDQALSQWIMAHPQHPQQMDPHLAAYEAPRAHEWPRDGGFPSDARCPDCGQRGGKHAPECTSTHWSNVGFDNDPHYDQYRTSSAFYNPFEFSHAEGPHDNPWTGAAADDLREGCKYCGAPGGEMHDPHCPVNHSDSPRDWEMDHKALGGPPLKVPDDSMHRLNSVQALLASVDELIGD